MVKPLQAPTEEVGLRVVLYALLYALIAFQYSAWLGSMSEDGCPLSLSVLVFLTSTCLLSLIFTHCLIYASYYDSRHISVKYERERRRLVENSRKVSDVDTFGCKHS